MKQYAQMTATLTKLNNLLKKTSIADAKQELINHYSALITPLLLKFYSETDDKKQLMHLGAFITLTKIHRDQIIKTLSRSTSNVSYARSFVMSSEGDKYAKQLGEILDAFKLILLENITENGQAQRTSLDFTPSTEPARSATELETRLYLLAKVQVVGEQLSSAKLGASSRVLAVNGAVFALIGPLTAIFTTAVHTTLIGDDFDDLTTAHKKVQAIQDGEAFTKWRIDANNMLMSQAPNTIAVNLLQIALGVENTEILNELTVQDIRIEDVEQIWPRSEHPAMYCPLSSKFLLDPVSLGSTGRTFNRQPISDALREKPCIDPITQLSISAAVLTTDTKVKDMMLEKIREHAKSKQQSSLVAS